MTTGNGNGVGKTGSHKQTKVMHPKERRSSASSPSSSRTVQIVFTVQSETGEIVQVERVDASGRRRELTDEECADLVDYGYSD